MAMNGTTMGDAIESAIEAGYGGTIDASSKAKMKTMWEAVALAIVTHIQNNMVVTSTVSAGIPVSSGGSTSAPGTAMSSAVS